MNRARRLATCALALLACAWAHAAAGPRYGEAPAPGLGGPIDLVDQDGQAFHLSRLAHRSALVFFGYTHCGTSCPVALATAHQVLAESASAPAVVFVTLDPMNDPPAVLRAYLRAFDERLIGVTGTPGAVMRVAERYGVGAERDSRSIGHSARWYLLDPAGRLARVYPSDTPAEQLAADLDRVAHDSQEASR